MFDLAQSALLVNLLKMRTVLFAPRSRLASIEYTITRTRSTVVEESSQNFLWGALRRSKGRFLFSSILVPKMEYRPSSGVWWRSAGILAGGAVREIVSQKLVAANLRTKKNGAQLSPRPRG